METDLISSFFNRYASPADEDDAAAVAHPTPAQVQQAVDELIEIIDPLPLPELDPEQRDDMAGKRFPDMQRLMFDCASGLRISPDIAAQIDATPEVFEVVARQDMEIGGFIKALQGLHEAVDSANLAAVGEASALCETTDQLVRAHTSGSGPLSPAAQIVLQNLFAEPARVRSEALANTPKDRKDRADLALSLDEQRAAEERKLAVSEFLADIQSGQATALGKRLAPSLGKPGAK